VIELCEYQCIYVLINSKLFVLFVQIQNQIPNLGVSEYTWDYSLLCSRLFILFLFFSFFLSLHICQLHIFFSFRSIDDITWCFLLVYPLIGSFQPYIGFFPHFTYKYRLFASYIFDPLSLFLNKPFVYIISAVTLGTKSKPQIQTQVQTQI